MKTSPTYLLAIIPLLSFGVQVLKAQDLPGRTGRDESFGVVLIDSKGPSLQTIADSNNRFAFDLFSRLNDAHDKNLIFSPLSISTALAMTYPGARGETELEMSRTLHFPYNQIYFSTCFRKFLDSINSDTGKGLVLDMANALWANKTYKFSPGYFNLVKTDYGSSLNNANFSEPDLREKARKEINSWVEGKTHQKIKELIAPGILNELTRLVLVNAIYFNGKWDKKFNPKATKPDTFHISSSRKIVTPFMHRLGEYNYFEDDHVQALELPYSGNKVSMVVILSKATDGQNKKEIKLDPAYYRIITGKMEEQHVQVSLPKFRITDQFELAKVLRSMGMNLPFTDAADFSGMSAGTAKELYITNVIHKAFVDVSEEGTEAAAATAVVMGLKMAAPPSTIKTFKADHPFTFLIKDNTTGSIMFMGEIHEPVVR